MKHSFKCKPSNQSPLVFEVNLDIPDFPECHEIVRIHALKDMAVQYQGRLRAAFKKVDAAGNKTWKVTDWTGAQTRHLSWFRVGEKGVAGKVKALSALGIKPGMTREDAIALLEAALTE
jgi:hypothetical protein